MTARESFTETIRLPRVLQPGEDHPLGATVTPAGINFAVASEHATRIELCVYDTSGARELRRYALHGPHDGVFHGRLPSLGAGLVYGLRAFGPYAPEFGHRFNPDKLLLDPYAREIVGAFTWRAEHHGYELGHPAGDRSLDRRDNGMHALKARVAAPLPLLKTPRPRITAEQRVLYEVHVKGFTARMAAIPTELRGTYAGMAHPAAIAHLQHLGITSVSLLPVQYWLDEPHLHERGLTNYWGYNTLGFFAPSPRLAHASHDPTQVVHEFRAMVEALHAARIEVILDVVYNHTPEGNESGPTLAWRGLDNASYYRLQAHDPSRYENYSGCGNTLDVAQPIVTRMVLDSLRYWVSEMGVDGFRFDLAPVLGRTRLGFDPDAPFFAALRQDPILARCTWIAEPWDIGPEGYRVGHFPGRFLEWNDKFRDTVRRYWLHRSVSRGEFARRLAASSDLFQRGQRRPTASVNYLTVHDGFCLEDVVSYHRKMNAANGEDNRDGRDGEPANNFGHDGPTRDPAVLEVRTRVKRALLATLLFARGTPMLAAGDELGKTQGGNNNAYCQDNAVSYLDWPQADHELATYVAALVAIRQAEPLLREDLWYTSPGQQPDNQPTIRWLTPHGSDMNVTDWHQSDTHTFGFQLIGRTDPDGARASMLFWFNPELCAATFTLPPASPVSPLRWQLLLDTAGELAPEQRHPAHTSLIVAAHSLILFKGVVSP
jgi:isoamylase